MHQGLFELASLNMMDQVCLVIDGRVSFFLSYIIAYLFPSSPLKINNNYLAGSIQVVKNATDLIRVKIDNFGEPCDSPFHRVYEFVL